MSALLMVSKSPNDGSGTCAEMTGCIAARIDVSRMNFVFTSELNLSFATSRVARRSSDLFSTPVFVPAEPRLVMLFVQRITGYGFAYR